MPIPVPGYPRRGGDVHELISELRRQSFDSNRIDVLQLSAGYYDYLSSSDVADMLRAFTFDSGHLEALRMLAPKIVDRQRQFVILDAFTFPSSKRETTAILSSYGRY